MRLYHAAFILCVLLPHGAHALGGVLVYVNGQDHDACPMRAGGTCLISGTADGDGTIDASQRTSAVGVVLFAPLDIPLLSDGSLVVRGDDLVAPNPVTPLVASFVGQRNMSVANATYIVLGMNETKLVRYGYYGPRYDDPTFRHRETAIYYDQDAKRGLRYDRFSPSDVGEDDTDHQVTATTGGTCAEPVDLGEKCQEALDGAASRVMDATPNVRVGFTWEAVGAANEISDFAPGAPPSWNGPSGTAARNTSRDASVHPTPVPQGEAPRHDDQVERPAAPPAPPRPGGPAPPGRQIEASPLLVASRGVPAPPVTPVAAAAAAFVLALAFKILYARIRSREDALEHDHRRRLLDILAQRGPRTVAELGSALGVDRSTALYHVRVLRRSASVTLAKQDRATYVLLPGQPLPGAAPHRGGRAASEILRLLREAGAPVPRSRLHALASHMPLRARNHAIRELAQRGAIVRGFAGNEETIALARGPGAAA